VRSAIAPWSAVVLDRFVWALDSFIAPEGWRTPNSASGFATKNHKNHKTKLKLGNPKPEINSRLKIHLLISTFNFQFSALIGYFNFQLSIFSFN
jgi:hypothetical protein